MTKLEIMVIFNALLKYGESKKFQKFQKKFDLLS